MQQQINKQLGQAGVVSTAGIPVYELKPNRSGYFEARWSERQPDGKYRSKTYSTGRKDKREAAVAADAFFRGMGLMAGVQKALTVEEIAREYVKAAEMDRGVQSQAQAMAPALAYFGKLTPGEITSGQIEAFKKARRLAGCSNGTIRRNLGALAAALQYGVNHKLMEIADKPYIAKPSDGVGREVWMDETEEASFWDQAVAHSPAEGQGVLNDVTLFVCIALETAARAEAIEDLTWDRVDLKSGRIEFRVPGARVTQKRRGVVAISSRLRPILERAFRERANRKTLISKPTKVPYRSWVKTTTLPHIHRHDLRRTWATLAARAGVSLFVIADVLSDNITTVMKHYAKHCPEHQKAAMELKLGRPMGVAQGSTVAQSMGA